MGFIAFIGILLFIIMMFIFLWIEFPEYSFLAIIVGALVIILLLSCIFVPLHKYIKRKKAAEKLWREKEFLRWKREEKIRQGQEEITKNREEIARKQVKEKEALRQRQEEAAKRQEEEKEALRQRQEEAAKRQEEELRQLREEKARQEEKARRWRQMLDDLPSNMLEVSPQEFFRLKESAQEFTGVYILHNESKDIYYVGQSVRVLGRVSQHFTGHGNGDVYADFKYGDTFTIRCLSLANSGYGSLDALEKDFIKRYNANITGYNKTQGNL